MKPWKWTSAIVLTASWVSWKGTEQSHAQGLPENRGRCEPLFEHASPGKFPNVELFRSCPTSS